NPRRANPGAAMDAAGPAGGSGVERRRRSIASSTSCAQIRLTGPFCSARREWACPMPDWFPAAFFRSRGTLDGRWVELPAALRVRNLIELRLHVANPAVDQLIGDRTLGGLGQDPLGGRDRGLGGGG